MNLNDKNKTVIRRAHLSAIQIDTRPSATTITLFLMGTPNMFYYRNEQERDAEFKKLTDVINLSGD